MVVSMNHQYGEQFIDPHHHDWHILPKPQGIIVILKLGNRQIGSRPLSDGTVPISNIELSRLGGHGPRNQSSLPALEPSVADEALSCG